MDCIVEELRAALPPVFLGSRIGDLTCGAVHWPTIQNRRSRKEIPTDCFVYAGRRVLVRRDPFLDWFATTLSATNPTTGAPPKRRGRRSAREA